MKIWGYVWPANLSTSSAQERDWPKQQWYHMMPRVWLNNRKCDSSVSNGVTIPQSVTAVYPTAWQFHKVWQQCIQRRDHSTKCDSSVSNGVTIPQSQGRLTVTLYVWGGADKSLARPGRKQATATKLGIYSTHSPRSSIHFLARCPNFFKPLKKKSEGCPSNQVSAAAMTPASDEKWRPFNCFFQSREQVVVRQGQIRRIGWVMKRVEAQVGQFRLGCKCPVSRGIVVQEQDHLGELPAAFFLQKSFNYTSREK